ncbi:unnamed protein product [Prorocentrum cordatum]|uniref:Uncharacterized protein n=1 Tax=Prorocentrum cordatum TaxID=2364126 RepID=A0ABN9PLI1_9DINO|nr:unnamed protein product [Polarella glacialis]
MPRWRRAFGGAAARCGLVALGLLEDLGRCGGSEAQAPGDLLSCDWDAGWASFRRRLEENARLGFPLDEELALGAQELLHEHQDALNPDPEAAYGASPGMGLRPPPFCLYGAVSALWVVARSGHPDREHLLGVAQFLLGSTIRGTLDFMEGSGWPLSSVDVLANLQRPAERFRLPAELRVEISHRNLVQDQYPRWLPDKCDTLYRYEGLTCDTVQDDITELFRRRIPHSAVSKEPIEFMNSFAEEFAAVAGDRLIGVDVFLCTVPYLCLLVADLHTPVLGYFGHPLLFLVPASARESFWSRFVAMAASDSFGLAVSDPFLQMQYEYQVGAPRLPAIRTHALYTEAVHFPVRDGEVLVMDRPHESVLMCMIQHLLPAATDANPEELDWPLGDGRLRAAGSQSYPYRFVTRSLTDKRFSTFAGFRAVVLWAYDMDLITFYEFYSMNMPLFMPSHLPKYVFQQGHMQYDGRWAGRRAEAGVPPMWPPDAETSPFNETSIDAVRLIAGFTDYFRFPDVQRFESIPDLLSRLPGTDFNGVVQSMARFNRDSLVESAGAWRRLLRKASGWDAELLPTSTLAFHQAKFQKLWDKRKQAALWPVALAARPHSFGATMAPTRKENKVASQPSVSAKQQSLAAKVKELEALLTKLREHPPGHGPAATGTTGASPPWAAAPGDADTVKRNRTKMLDQLLRVTTDPADADTVAKWREERAKLDAELFQDRPIEHQARSLAPRLSAARSRQATIQATRDEQQKKIDELTRGLADTDSKLQEATAEVLRLEQQTRTAMSRVQPPEGTQPPSLADLLPSFAVSVEQLGKVATGLGLGADMVKELQAMADTVSKLQNLPQESDTPDIVREKFKRFQQSYLDTVAKKCHDLGWDYGARIISPTGPLFGVGGGSSDPDRGSAYVGCARSWVLGVYGVTEGYSAYAYAVGPWQHALLTDLTFGERRQRAPTVFGRHAPLTALAHGESRNLKLVRVQAQFRLGEFQARALDAGWHGLWAPSPSTGDSATSNFGGVAVLVPTYIMVPAPPDDGHIIYPGRAVCAQINWGVAGGIIVASVYLVTPIDISGENIEVLWALAQRVAAWNSRGLDWILGGDWNADIDALNVRNWVETMAAIHYVPDQHTCITDEGKSTIGYFVVCANLASRIKGKPEVQYDSKVVPPPHFPVELQLMGEDRPTWCRVPVEPRPFAVVPPVGCARYPYPWHMIQSEFQQVSSVDDLSSLWDSVLRGVGYELAGRCDCVGAKAMQYIGREGPPQFKWQLLSWQPPRRRTYKEPSVLAWATARRWAQRLVAEKKRLVRYIERLKLCAAICAITPLQCTEVVVAFNEVAAFYGRVARSEQYVSPVLREVSNLARAAKAFTADAGDLGMVLKPPKSGCIPGSQKVWGQLKRHLGTLKIPYRAHMRNLGHELTGPRVLRRTEKRRLVQFRERKHRFRMLKSAWRMAEQLLELVTAPFVSCDIVLLS